MEEQDAVCSIQLDFISGEALEQLLAEQLDNTMRLCGQTVINYMSKAFAPQWCGLPEQFHCAGSGHI